MKAWKPALALVAVALAGVLLVVATTPTDPGGGGLRQEAPGAHADLPTRPPGPPASRSGASARAGAAEVLVTDLEGREVEGARVEAVPVGDAKTVGASTDAAGRAALAPLAAGSWAFRASAGGGVGNAGRPVSIAPGERATVRIVLRPASDLTGLVTLDDGTPAAGAPVRLAPRLSEELARTVVADAEGRYRFSALAPGTYLIAAAPAGLVLEACGELAVPATRVWNVRLPGRAAASGRVTLAGDGTPVAGVRVVVESPLGELETTADADGRWRVDGIPAMRATRIGVRSPAFVSPEEEAPLRWRYLSPGRDTRVDLEVRAGAVLVGTVRDPAGEPVPEAHVVLRGWTPWGRSFERETAADAEGGYRLEALPFGRALLLGRADGLLSSCPDRIRDALRRREPGTFEIPASGEIRRDLVLVAAARLGGSVRDEEGRPLSGARLVLRAVERRGDLASAATDAAGRFAFANVPPHEDLAVAATSPGRAAARSEVPALGAGEVREDLDLKLPAAAVVRVLVRDAAGRPIPGATYRVADLARDDPPDLDSWSWSPDRALAPDGTGEAHLDGSGAWFAVSVRAPGRTCVATEPRPVPEPGATVELRLTPALPVVLSGRVVDAGDGRPVAHARVFSYHEIEIGRASVRTDAEGRFRLVVARDDEGYDLHVHADGYSYERLASAQPPAAGFRVELTPTAEVRVRIVGPEGEPAPGVELELIPEGGGGHPRATADANGRASLVAPRSGRFELLALPHRAQGSWGRHRAGPFTPGDGEIEIVLPRLPAIAGRLVDEGGRGIPGERVEVRGGRHAASTVSRPDGSFTLGGLPAGSYEVRAGTPGGRFAPTELPGVDAGTEDLRIVLRTGLTIEGLVVDEHGRAVQGIDARVDLVRDADDRFQVYGHLRPDGSFVFQGLPVGTYTLYFEPRFSGDWVEVNLEGVEAGSTAVRIRTRAAGRISGTVVDAEGRPVEDLSVVAFSANDPVYGLTWACELRYGAETGTDHRGRFVLEGLPPELRYLVVAGGGNEEWSSAAVPGVSPGADELRLEVRRGRTLRGRLLDAAGKPVRDALVGVFDARGLPVCHAITGWEGRFVLHGLPAGKVRLEALTGAGRPRQPLGELVPADGEVTLRLPR